MGFPCVGPRRRASDRAVGGHASATAARRRRLLCVLGVLESAEVQMAVSGWRPVVIFPQQSHRRRGNRSWTFYITIAGRSHTCAQFRPISASQVAAAPTVVLARAASGSDPASRSAPARSCGRTVGRACDRWTFPETSDPPAARPLGGDRIGRWGNRQVGRITP